MKAIKVCGVYTITNNINNKKYVGSSVNIKKRFENHRFNLKTNTHKNKKLQMDWNKYGNQNFTFEILEICEKHILLEKEQMYINKFKSKNNEFGYNEKAPCKKNDEYRKRTFQTTIKKSLIKDLKHQAVEEKRDANSIIEEALEDYFKKKDAK